jgi:hypothetical protein
VATDVGCSDLESDCSSKAGLGRFGRRLVIQIDGMLEIPLKHWSPSRVLLSDFLKEKEA